MTDSNLSYEPKVNTVSKFNSASFSGIISPGDKIQLPKNRFHNRNILITNTGKTILQIYRTFSVKDIIPIKSVIFYPGEVRKISSNELGDSITDVTIIFNSDNYREGGFAMSYI